MKTVEETRKAFTDATADLEANRRAIDEASQLIASHRSKVAVLSEAVRATQDDYIAATRADAKGPTITPPVKGTLSQLGGEDCKVESKPSEPATLGGVGAAVERNRDVIEEDRRAEGFKDATDSHF